MPVVGGDQISLNVGVYWRLMVWIFLRFFEDIFCADLTQEIADQHTALAIDECVDCQRVLAFEFHHTDRALGTGWTQVAVVKPERFDGIAKLRFSLRVQFVHEIVENGRVCVQRSVMTN